MGLRFWAKKKRIKGVDITTPRELISYLFSEPGAKIRKDSLPQYMEAHKEIDQTGVIWNSAYGYYWAEKRYGTCSDRFFLTDQDAYLDYKEQAKD